MEQMNITDFGLKLQGGCLMFWIIVNSGVLCKLL